MLIFIAHLVEIPCFTSQNIFDRLEEFVIVLISILIYMQNNSSGRMKVGPFLGITLTMGRENHNLKIFPIFSIHAISMFLQITCQIVLHTVLSNPFLLNHWFDFILSCLISGSDMNNVVLSYMQGKDNQKNSTKKLSLLSALKFHIFVTWCTMIGLQ